MSVLKKILSVFTLVLVFSSLVASTSFAYSLDDVKKDYPKLKIETTKYKDDTGRLITSRSMKVMKLYGEHDSHVTLTLWLMERNYIKFCRAVVFYRGTDWVLFNKLTIGDGSHAFNISTPYEPTRERSGSYFVEETVVFDIWTRSEFSLWKKAKQLRIKGRYYDDFCIDPVEYDAVMSLVNKYLFNGTA